MYWEVLCADWRRNAASQEAAPAEEAPAAAAAAAAAATAPSDSDTEDEVEYDLEQSDGRFSPKPLEASVVAGQAIIHEDDDLRMLDLLRQQVTALA